MIKYILLIHFLFNTPLLLVLIFWINWFTQYVIMWYWSFRIIATIVFISWYIYINDKSMR